MVMHPIYSAVSLALSETREYSCSQLSPSDKNQWIKFQEFYDLVDFALTS